jgi:Icc-related predicted phosphoesterase
MKICFISDTHSKHGFGLHDDLLEPADVIVHAGDISTRGFKQEIENFLVWFSGLKQFTHKVFIAGNHDFGFQDFPSDVRNLLDKYPEVIYLQEQEVVIDEIKFWGSPATPYFYNWAFNYMRGDDIDRIWKKIPEDVDVLITHGPPYMHGDEVPNLLHNDERNVGCKDLMRHIERIKPQIHVFGHIHCGYGITFNEDTQFINASVLDEQYQYANKPTYIEIT